MANSCSLFCDRWAPLQRSWLKAHPFFSPTFSFFFFFFFKRESGCEGCRGSRDLKLSRSAAFMMHVAGGQDCSEHMLRSLLAFWRRSEGQSISHEAVFPQGLFLGYPNDFHAPRCKSTGLDFVSKCHWVKKTAHTLIFLQVRGRVK